MKRLPIDRPDPIKSDGWIRRHVFEDLWSTGRKSNEWIELAVVKPANKREYDNLSQGAEPRPTVIRGALSAVAKCNSL